MALKLIREFPEKGWTVSDLNKLSCKQNWETMAVR